MLRSHLSALLPRLRRFALLLEGDTESGDALLRLALQAMLDEPERSLTNLPFDHWALAQVYSVWLRDLRGREEPMAQSRADEELLNATLEEWGADDLETPNLAGFLASLPPQQRASALLVYGEGLSYEQAAEMLDAPPDAISSRTTRALSGLVERLGLQPVETPASAEIEHLYPEQEQAVS